MAALDRPLRIDAALQGARAHGLLPTQTLTLTSILTLTPALTLALTPTLTPALTPTKVLAAMGGVQSLNEPDVYTGLGRTSEPTDAAAAERAATLRPVVRACTQLLLHAQRLRRPDKELIVIKTRASVVRCHALLREALPGQG